MDYLVKLLINVMSVSDKDAKLVVSPIASPVDKPFFRSFGNSGITISEPGLILGYFLKIKNCLICTETPFAYLT
jgi:hypothetical protein